MSVDKIRPVEGRVLVLPDPAPEKTDSGLFIPDSVERPSQSGRVIKAAPDSVFNVDDHVLYQKDTGVPLTLDKVTYLLLREENVYAVI